MNSETIKHGTECDEIALRIRPRRAAVVQGRRNRAFDSRLARLPPARGTLGAVARQRDEGAVGRVEQIGHHSRGREVSRALDPPPVVTTRRRS